MKFLVHQPKQLDLTKGINLFDMREFYKNLKQVLVEDGHEFIIKNSTTNELNFPGIFLSWHTQYKNKLNVWNIKKGYVPRFIYFDRTGYSGWAEIANNEKLFDKSQNTNLIDASNWFDSFAKDYIGTNFSKIEQSVKNTPLPEKFVFLASQIPNDTVVKLSRVDIFLTLAKVAEYFKNTEWKVVFKPHPLLKGGHPKKFDEVCRKYGLIKTSNSIHNIFPKASAVFVINSGVGFEALFHKKKVFCFGHSDYHWVTHKVDVNTTSKEIIDQMKMPVDEKRLIKFMYYIMNDYFVKTDDKESIRARIQTTIKEYKK